MKENKGNEPTKLGRLNFETLKELTKDVKSDENSLTVSDEDLRLWLDYSKPYSKSNPLKFDEKIEAKEPDAKFFDRNYLQLTFDQVKNLHTDDLYKLLSGENHSGAINDKTVQLISSEILSRQIKEASKPHWTITPTLIVATIAAVASVLALLK